MHAHLDTRHVRVEDRRRHRSERRAGVEAALQDQQPVVEADKRMAKGSPETEPDRLSRLGVQLELAAQAAAEDLDAADERLAGEQARPLDRETAPLLSAGPGPPQ